MLIPRRDKILISITASFVSIQGPVLLVHGRPRILNKGGSIVLSEKGQFPMSADTSPASMRAMRSKRRARRYLRSVRRHTRPSSVCSSSAPPEKHATPPPHRQLRPATASDRSTITKRSSSSTRNALPPVAPATERSHDEHVSP